MASKKRPKSSSGRSLSGRSARCGTDDRARRIAFTPLLASVLGSSKAYTLEGEHRLIVRAKDFAPADLDSSPRVAGRVRHPLYDGSIASKTERLNLRLTPAQDAILRSAAEARGESASEYVLRHAVQAAEVDLADRRVFIVDDAAWEELQRLISAPASLPEPMAKRLTNPTVLERPSR
ncbi:MAG: type II toxin-antitoxin system TacA family antitoxin [Acidimicrobiales bacterium]